MYALTFKEWVCAITETDLLQRPAGPCMSVYSTVGLWEEQIHMSGY